MGMAGYALDITEGGEVVLTTSVRAGYGTWLYDPGDGSFLRLGAGSDYASLYGFSQETGDALVFESTGTRGALRYYRYSR
jgi:hypothetical protein